MSDATIEQEIQAKGLTAPRVTPSDIDANIASEHYFTAQHGVEGAFAKLELHQRHADTDTLTQPAPRPPFEALSLLTFCILVLRNGFTVTGESACASPDNFDAELGRKIARQNAVQKIWSLMGYALKDDIHRKRAWICSSCCSHFPEGIPSECPHNANGCNEHLARGE